MRMLWLVGFLVLGCQSDKVVMDSGSFIDEGIAAGDSDRDGVPSDQDCDDEDASVYPDAQEICDGLDNDCDGEVDEGLTTLAYIDEDKDGYGDPASGRYVCELEGKLVLDNTDCDDADPDIHPDQEDICDGLDNDCDLKIDEDAEGSIWYEDVDGDGHGDPETGSSSCSEIPPEGQVALGDDCDDTLPDVHPGAPERCDGIDNDCNGLVDDGVTTLWYLDLDGDGAGDATMQLESCDPAAGYVDNGDDCDDTDPGISPWSTEVCNGWDDDCDGYVDEADAPDADIWYVDDDGDGFGDSGGMRTACEAPSGYVANADDCDDMNAAVHPDALEVCNGIDDDCDTLVDVDDADLIDGVTYYSDDDGDGFGAALTGVRACEAPSGAVLDDSDCDDLDAAVHPDAEEVCNGIDDDCDSRVDDADGDVTDAVTYYRDDDGDGFGSDLSSERSCEVPSGAVLDDSDCDDLDAAVHPDAEEICNGIDDDCDGRIDDEDGDVIDMGTYYTDADGDGYGSGYGGVEACEGPSGSVLDDSDCNDWNASVHPGAEEVCNGIDDDCDDRIDADDPDVTDAVTYFIDHDGDGYGSDAYLEVACEEVPGFVADDSDCDDLDGAVYPGAEETCNGVDDDCDGELGWQELDVDGDGRMACHEALWLETSRSYHNDPASASTYGSLEAASMLTDHGLRSTSSVLYSVPLTAELLDQYGVLVIYGQGYDGPLSADESEALANWIYDGGGLLYMGGWGSSSTCNMLNSLPVELGIRCASHAYTWSGTSSVSSSHPVADGVSTISGLGGELWSVTAPATTLATTTGWPTVAVSEYGEGRVVGLADEWPMYNPGTGGYYDLGAYNNMQLIDNIWGWLSAAEL